MHPLTFITGIVFGSSGLIFLVLILVMIIKAVLLASGDLDPTRAELEGQYVWLSVFAGLTVVSTVSFLSLVKQWRGWRIAQVVMWVSLLVFFLNLGDLRGG